MQILDQYGKPVPPTFDAKDGDLFPHHATFAGILNLISRTYSHRWDEAVKHLPQNALAMRRDAYLHALEQERILPTVHCKWQIETDESDKDADQKRVCEMLSGAVRRIPRLKKMLHYLLKATWYGRYGAHVKKGDVLISGTKWRIPVKHNPVNGDKIQSDWDGNDLVYLNPTLLNSPKYPRESVVYTDRVPALRLDRPEWREQFVIHRHEAEDVDYFEPEMAGQVSGVGLRSRIYWCWWLRDEFLSWAVDYMQKVGTLGLLIFWYEQGNQKAQAKAEENAREASRKSTLVMPRPAGRDGSTYGVERIEGGTAGIQFLTQMISEYFERQIERAYVGQSMSSGGGGAGGLEGDGRAGFAADTKYQILKWDAENLAETLTEDLLRPMVRDNLPSVDFECRFKFMVPDPDDDKRMSSAQTVTSMGVSIKADDVRELSGFSKPEEGDETVGGKPALSPTGAPGQMAAPQAPTQEPEEEDPSLADLFSRPEAPESVNLGWDEWHQIAGGKWESPQGRVLSDPVFQRMKQLNPHSDSPRGDAGFHKNLEASKKDAKREAYDKQFSRLAQKKIDEKSAAVHPDNAEVVNTVRAVASAVASNRDPKKAAAAVKEVLRDHRKRIKADFDAKLQKKTDEAVEGLPKPVASAVRKGLKKLAADAKLDYQELALPDFGIHGASFDRQFRVSTVRDAIDQLDRSANSHFAEAIESHFTAEAIADAINDTSNTNDDIGKILSPVYSKWDDWFNSGENDHSAEGYREKYRELTGLQPPTIDRQLVEKKRQIQKQYPFMYNGNSSDENLEAEAMRDQIEQRLDKVAESRLKSLAEAIRKKFLPVAEGKG